MTETGAAAEAELQAPLQWDDHAMATSFANVVNIQSTREQLELFFGTSLSWNGSGERKLTVALSNRLILTPHAAKRLLLALGGVMREYESRYGSVEI